MKPINQENVDLRKRIAELESELATERGRLAGIVLSGVLDQHTAQRVQEWVREYHSATVRAATEAALRWADDHARQWSGPRGESEEEWTSRALKALLGEDGK